METLGYYVLGCWFGVLIYATCFREYTYTNESGHDCSGLGDE